MERQERRRAGKTPPLPCGSVFARCHSLNTPAYLPNHHLADDHVQAPAGLANQQLQWYSLGKRILVADASLPFIVCSAALHCPLLCVSLPCNALSLCVHYLALPSPLCVPLPSVPYNGAPFSRRGRLQLLHVVRRDRLRPQCWRRRHNLLPPSVHPLSLSVPTSHTATCSLLSRPPSFASPPTTVCPPLPSPFSLPPIRSQNFLCRSVATISFADSAPFRRVLLPRAGVR